MEDFPGIATAQKEFHPDDLFPLGSGPPTASWRKGQLSRFHVKTAITHHRLLLHVANTDADGGIGLLLTFSTFDRGFQIAIAVNGGNALLWDGRNILASNGVGKRIRETQGNGGCCLGKEIAGTKLGQMSGPALHPAGSF
jgi:hypothetical protein